MDGQQIPDGVPSIETAIDTLCFGLWQVIKYAKECNTTYGNQFNQALADRIRQTPMPDHLPERVQYQMIKDLAVMLATTRSKPQ